MVWNCQLSRRSGCQKPNEADHIMDQRTGTNCPKKLDVTTLRHTLCKSRSTYKKQDVMFSNYEIMQVVITIYWHYFYRNAKMDKMMFNLLNCHLWQLCKVLFNFMNHHLTHKFFWLTFWQVSLLFLKLNLGRIDKNELRLRKLSKCNEI